MKSIVSTAILAVVVALSTSALQAQEMPGHVLAVLDRLVGKWTMERVVDGKTSRSDFELEWTIPNTTLLFRWKGADGLTGKQESSVGILGWDPVRQVIVEHEIGSGGFTADCTHIIAPDGTWTSPSTGTTVIDGKPVYHQSHRVFKIISNDEWTVRSEGGLVDGKPQGADVSTLRRKK